MQDENDTLALAARWVYFCNVQRPHLGEGMDKQTPLEVLQRLGYNGSDQIALFSPIVLGRSALISSSLATHRMVTIY
jgi:hypothetical protein